MNRASGAAGFTLVELIVGMAIIALTLAVASLSLSGAFDQGKSDGWASRLERARMEAIETGRPVVAVPDSAHRTPPVLFLPDGRAVGSGLDPLSGFRSRSGARP